MKSKTDISPQEMTDRLQSGTLSRRQFQQMLAGAGIAMVATPVLSPSALAAPADQGTYFTWGGYDIPELFAPYIEQHGEAPNFAAFGGSEEGLTKLMGGYVVDVAHPCNAVLPRWVASGLLQPFDLSQLSNWDDVIPALKNLEGSVQNGGTYFAPMDWGQTSITLPRGPRRPAGRRRVLGHALGRALRRADRRNRIGRRHLVVRHDLRGDRLHRNDH